LLQGHGHRDAQLGVVFFIIRYGDDFDVRTAGRGREGRRRATVFEGTFRANDAAEILEVEFPFLLFLLLAVSVQVAGEDIVDCPFNVDILCLQRLARTEMGTEMFPVGDLMGAWEGSLWGEGRGRDFEGELCVFLWTLGYFHDLGHEALVQAGGHGSFQRSSVGRAGALRWTAEVG
jgi:hypothetical protein